MMLRFGLPLVLCVPAGAAALPVLGFRRRRWGYFAGAAALALLLAAGYFLLVAFITAM